MELGTFLFYIYVLRYVSSRSLVLFSQAVAPSDNSFLNNPEKVKGFRQTNRVG